MSAEGNELPILSYRGQCRDGTATVGAIREPVAVLAERLFDQRWRWAVIHDSTGREVGGVTATIAGPRNARTWWAES